MKFTAIANRFLFFGTLFSLVLVSSCKKDKELDRDKFLGVYSVLDPCDSGTPESYEITILESESESEEDEIIIDNLRDSGDSIIATVAGNTLTFYTQSLGSHGASGNGSISDNILTINLSIHGPSPFNFDCIVTCTKII